MQPTAQIHSRVQDICPLSTCRNLVEESIGCDRCLCWYHQECSRLTHGDFNVYLKHSTLRWICDRCVALSEECSRLLIASASNMNTRLCPPTPRVTPQTNATKSPRLAIQAQRDKGGAQFVESGPSNVKRSSKMKPKQARGRMTCKGIMEVSPSPGRRDLASPNEDLKKEVDSLKAKLGHLESELKGLKTMCDTYLSRAKSVLLHNCPEPVVVNTKHRRENELRRVRDILRIAGLPWNTLLSKVHRVGQWKNGSNNTAPRPLLVVFPQVAIRDRFLSRARLVEDHTGGAITITGDGVTISSEMQTHKTPVLKVRQPNIELQPVKATTVDDATPKAVTTVRCNPKPKKRRTPPRAHTPTSSGITRQGTPSGTPVHRSTPKRASEGRNSLSSRVGTGRLPGSITVTSNESGRAAMPDGSVSHGARALELSRLADGEQLALNGATNVCVSPRGIAWDISTGTKPSNHPKNVPAPRVLRPRVRT